MVKQGKFSVEIIHADSKMAFPEHTAPNGEIYVEVEPDAEYYIRLQTDSEDLVSAAISVDGKRLGYRMPITKRNIPRDAGLWKCEKGKSYHYALKFAKAHVRQPTLEDNEGTYRPFWTGAVEVDFYEETFDGYENGVQEHHNTWKGGDVSFVMGISDPDKKKGVKSDQGSSFHVQKARKRRARYITGGFLKKVTLRYCSTLGLIHANILPKPPMWDYLRLSHPADEAQEDTNVPNPKIVKREYGGDVEVFDLS